MPNVMFFIVMLSVVVLNVPVLNVIMLNEVKRFYKIEKISMTAKCKY